MQAAPSPSRYVSVSELYSTDEVELLLEEIRELEPTSCRGEELTDCEIAGSGGAGGRSPAGTDHSWDSHAHYRRAPPPPPRPLAPLYCRLPHLAEPQGALTLLLVLCSVASCSCVWAAVGLRPWLLPLASRVRVLLLGAFSSWMLHTVLLLMHITQLTALLPINWNKLCMWTSIWSFTSMSVGASLTLHAVLAEPEYRWTPLHLAHLLYSASGLGACGACVALALAVCEGARLLPPRAPARPPAPAAPASSASLRTAYRAVPSAPPPHHPHHQPQPSTSRDNPL